MSNNNLYNNCHILMFKNDKIDSYAQFSEKIWHAYGEKHGYQFFAYNKIYAPQLATVWQKIYMMLDHLENHTCEYILMVDADTYVTKKGIDQPLSSLKFPCKDIIFARDKWNKKHLFKRIYLKKWILENTGCMLVKNTDFSRNFISVWIHHAKGKFQHLADKHPRTQQVLWYSMRAELKQTGLMSKQVFFKGTTENQIYHSKQFCFHLSSTPDSVRASIIKKAWQVCSKPSL